MPAEDSHLALRLWLQAIHLLCSSKKGISTRQLQRTLGCGMKTAWHLGHRIRHAMAPGNPAQLGGLGKGVSDPASDHFAGFRGFTTDLNALSAPLGVSK
jgi:hypothetical protein